MEEAGLGRAMFAEVDPNPNERTSSRRAPSSAPAAMTGSSPLAAAPGSILARWSPSWPGRRRPVWDFEDIGDWWTRADADGHRADRRGADHGRHRVGGRPRRRADQFVTHVKKIIFHPKVLPAS
jgi:alcohol dehydrogenase